MHVRQDLSIKKEANKENLKEFQFKKKTNKAEKKHLGKSSMHLPAEVEAMPVVDSAA